MLPDEEEEEEEGPEGLGSPPSLPPHAIAVTTPTAPPSSKTNALLRIAGMLAADVEMLGGNQYPGTVGDVVKAMTRPESFDFLVRHY